VREPCELSWLSPIKKIHSRRYPRKRTLQTMWPVPFIRRAQAWRATDILCPSSCWLS
jgi:hypothetical protein